MRAEFTPEEINLRWYNNNTLLNVPTTSNTCTYDTAINLPTNPTKPGYKFAGWEIVPEYDFSTLPTNEDFIIGYGKHQYDRCRRFAIDNLSGTYETCSDAYSDLNTWEFKIVFSYGTIYGMSICSDTPGTMGAIGTPNEINGYNSCWCRVTGYIPNDSSIKYAPTQALPWVFRYTHATTDRCITGCASRCTFLLGIEGGETARRNAFGITQ